MVPAAAGFSISTSFSGGVGDREVRVAGPALGGLGAEETPVELHRGVDVAHVQGELDAGHAVTSISIVCRYGCLTISTSVNIDRCRCPSPTAPCCPPVLHARLGKADAEELASAFSAIADPARLRLLSFIAAQPGGEACVCHLLKPLDLSQPTVEPPPEGAVRGGAARAREARDLGLLPDRARAPGGAARRARASEAVARAKAARRGGNASLAADAHELGAGSPDGCRSSTAT